jgi:hypothetical protein
LFEAEMFTETRIMDRVSPSLYNTVCSNFEYRVSLMSSPGGLKMGVRDIVAEVASTEHVTAILFPHAINVE